MKKYSKVVLDAIEREKAGTDYFCPGTDKDLLQGLLAEINKSAGLELQYLAELDAVKIPGSGEIIARYIQLFSTESVRGYLLPQLVSNKIKDCDRLVLSLYMHFKSSDEYISKPGFPAPAHIYTRYDNAIRMLKPKRLKDELIKLVHYPRDAFYLPFTMRMLASWKIPELQELLLLYSSDSYDITPQDIGLGDSEDSYFPSLSFIRRELRFTAIDGLKYYPSDETSELIRQYSTDSDPDIRVAAKRTLKVLAKST